MKVRVTRLRDDIPLPAYGTPGAACFDIAVTEDVTIAPKELALLPTGLVFCVPEGHFLMVAARSSTPVKRGLMLANGIGIIDPDFCGPEDELRIEVWNYTDAPVTLKKGDRIAQGGFVRIDRADWDEGPAEGPTRGGIGSTGH